MKKRKKSAIIVLLALIAAVAILVWMACCFKCGGLSAVSSLFRRGPRLEFQKGMCYVTWNRDRYLDAASDKSLDKVAGVGVKWVALVATWYQDKVYSPTISAGAETPNDASLIHAIQEIHKLGMKVMLKPHLDLKEVSGSGWRGEISFPDDESWNRWFSSYGEFILHYAKLAQENGVDMLCIGTELSNCATTREELWKTKVISPVRGVYKGPLTYAANWQEEYKYVKFWKEMDYVGIDAYFPLSDKRIPTLEEIKEGWKKWVEEIDEFQMKVSKPIIFPEVGYCSAEGAAITPWVQITSGKVDLKLQADLYQALCETFWDKPYFYGVYWWMWGTDVRFGGQANKGFTPQNKKAQEIVEKWYKKGAPFRNPSIFSRSSKE